MSEQTYRCPKCDPAQTRSRKLYINSEKGVFNCFRCGFKGPVSRLNAEFPELIASLESSFILSEHLKFKNFNLFSLSEASRSVISSLEPVFQIEHSDPEYSYLKNRGWTDLMINIYGPLKSNKKSYKDYVILPIYNDDNDIIYYVGRDITDKQPSKYKNSPVPKTDVVFKSNLSEEVFFKDDVFICEGIFDAAKIPSSIALLGKTVSKNQHSVIFELLKHKKNIYLCLDFGTDKDSNELYKLLSSWLPKATYHKLEYSSEEDLGKMSETLDSMELGSWIKDNSKILKGDSFDISNIKDRFCLAWN